MWFPVSYRDLEEIMAERGVIVAHPALNRWVGNYSPLSAQGAHKRKAATAITWGIDETYIKVKDR